jgi:hypothetical protein
MGKGSKKRVTKKMKRGTERDDETENVMENN